MNVIEDFQAKKETFGISKQELGSEAPIWQPDWEVQRCGICNESFSFIKRRVKYYFLTKKRYLYDFFSIIVEHVVYVFVVHVLLKN